MLSHQHSTSVSSQVLHSPCWAACRFSVSIFCLILRSFSSMLILSRPYTLDRELIVYKRCGKMASNPAIFNGFEVCHEFFKAFSHLGITKIRIFGSHHADLASQGLGFNTSPIIYIHRYHHIFHPVRADTK